MCSTRFSQRLTFGGWTGKKVENTRLNSTFQDEEGDETIQPRVGSSITNRSPPTIWGQIWFCGSGFVWELTSFGIVGDLRTWSFPAPRWGWMGGLVTQHQHFLHQVPPNWVLKWWFLDWQCDLRFGDLAPLWLWLQLPLVSKMSYLPSRRVTGVSPHLSQQAKWGCHDSNGVLSDLFPNSSFSAANCTI